MMKKATLDIPQYLLLFILQYIGNPEDFLVLLLVCKGWRDRFDIQDGELWKIIAISYNTQLHLSKVNKSLRSKSNFKKLFLHSYMKRKKDLREKHDLLVSLAKTLLEKKTDRPQQLKKLILTTILDKSDLNPNWKCISLESNSLVTLAARYGHAKCVKLMIDHFKSDINICDVGGFTPLILCAYIGCFSGVQFLVRRGADTLQMGSLRSGKPLTAEHWAAIQGHLEIFEFLKAIRIRREAKALGIKPSKMLYSHGTMLPSNATVAPGSDGTDLFPDNNNNNNNMMMTVGGSFCVCGRGFVGKMIACDREGCSVEWYHFDCVGLEEEVNYLHCICSFAY